MLTEMSFIAPPPSIPLRQRPVIARSMHYREHR